MKRILILLLLSGCSTQDCHTITTVSIGQCGQDWSLGCSACRVTRSDGSTILACEPVLGNKTEVCR